MAPADKARMRCTESPTIRRLLSGELNAEATLKAMDHARTCPACRDQLVSSSAMMEHIRRPSVPTPAENAAAERGPGAAPARSATAGAKPESAAAVAASNDEDAVSIPRSSYMAKLDISEERTALRAAKKGGLLRLGLFLGIAALAGFGWITRQKGLAEAALSETKASILLLESAIGRGLPYLEDSVDAPKGRPKAISVFLPIGNRAFSVRFQKDGAAPLSVDYAAGQEGVYFEDGERKGKAVFRFVEAVAPFPSAETLPLEKGVRYWIYAVLPNGCESRPIRFVLDA